MDMIFDGTYSVIMLALLFVGTGAILVSIVGAVNFIDWLIEEREQRKGKKNEKRYTSESNERRSN